MKIFRIIVITIVFIALIIVNPLYSQSYEKGGFITGGSVNINFTDEKRSNLLHTDINIDYDLGYLITNRSLIGYRFSLLLNNEKNNEKLEEYYAHRNARISYCYFKTNIKNPIYLEIYGGYGKDHFKSEASWGAKGAHDYHIADFGAGIQYHRFISQKIVLISGISYDHFILFVKDIE